MTKEKAGGEASLEIGGEPDGYSKNPLPESRNIIGSVDSVRRGGLIRQVPPAEEPAESAAKKRQHDRSHRLKERESAPSEHQLHGRLA